MSVTTVSGTVDTESILADERVVDMVEEFQLLDPDESQFTTMLGKLSQTAARREKINWLEDQWFPNLSTLAASCTSAASTITVATGTGAYFNAGDLVRNQISGEMYEVVSVATDTVTISRAIGGVSATSSVSGANLLIVGNAYAQGAGTGTAKITQRVLNYNYHEIIRRSFSFTNTDAWIDTYGPDQVAGEAAKKAVEQKRALENTFFFGARKFTSAAPSSKGYCGGAIEYISTNVFQSVGTLSLSVLDTKLTTIFQHGSMNKVIFCAPVPAQAMSGLLAANWVRAQPDDKVYGAKVSAWVNGAYGTSIPVIVKRDWGRYSTASNQYGSFMFVLDMQYIKQRPAPGRNTQLLRDRQLPGEDKVTHEYLTETSLQFAVEQAHGLLTGITG